jgi:hypothetical protein
MGGRMVGMVLNAFETATVILKRGRSVLESGARTLMVSESLGEAQLAKLGRELAVAPGVSVPPPQDRMPLSTA